MLCLNCQQPIGSGSGFDAGKDAYQIYLNAGRANNAFCSPQQNKTLPTDIQSAVCNQNIKIYDDLYNIFWGDGTWFYTFTSQTITKDQNADPNKIFTKCPKQSSSGTPSSTGSTSPSSTSNDQSSDNQASSSGIGTGAIVGIAVGVVVLAIAGALAGFFFVRRRRRAQYVNASGLNIDDDGPQGPPPPAPNPYPYTPSGVTSPVSGPGSDPAMSQYNAPSTATGSYFPPASVPGRSSHSESGQPLSTSYYGSASGSQTGSGSGVSGASTAPFVVSNPDGSGTQPQSPPALRKGAAPNAGMTYVPAASSSDMSERHMDAGPAGGSSLQRNASGRLPPAYGDLVRG
ncbi:hypothetical protein V5O48_015006 [Marasmius crinis-equi]|uniref:Uncharacterized protein n=1 Tax=Marasmius crinis-equi TaxID=585013 RepID=A0ABR3EW16_9AGAR